MFTAIPANSYYEPRCNTGMAVLSPYPSYLKKHVFKVLFFLPWTVMSCVQKRQEVLRRRKQEQQTQKQLAQQGGEIQHSLAGSVSTSCFESFVSFLSELFPFTGLWAASRPIHSIVEPSSTVDHNPPCIPNMIRISEGHTGTTWPSSWLWKGCNVIKEQKVLLEKL